MREQTMRSSYYDRNEHRPHPGSKPRQSNPRTKRSTNLSRLCDELGSDLLAVALGLSDEALRILMDGRDHVKSGQYANHLSHRMQELGVPPDWLDRPLAPIAPEYLRALRIQAASAPNKSPIRRANFRRIAQSFSGRESLLADALEMVEPSIINVADGSLILDEGRFSHINPRLMQAGFPDGWLEQAEPDLTDDMLTRLEQLATDSYELRLSENDDDDNHSSTNAGQAFVSPQQSTAEATSSQPVATSVTSKESVMATTQAQAQPTNPSESPRAPKTFKAGGAPTAAPKPAVHPSAGKLPRNVLAAGRKIGGAPTQPTPSAAATAQKPAAAKAPTKAAAVPKATPKPAAQKPAKNATPSAPAARTGTAPTKDVSLARATALDQILETSRRGAKVALWRDILGSSLAVWGNVRRGAILFRNDWADNAEKAMGLPQGWLDNPSFPPASLAAWVTDLEAPVPTPLEVNSAPANTPASAPADTPASAPAAATKAKATKPAQQKAATPQAPAAAPQKPSATKPFSRKTPAAPRITMTTAPAGAPQFPGAAPAAAAAAPAAPAAATIAASVAAPAAPAPAAAVVAAPVASPAALTTPATPGIGPLAQALLSIIQQRAASGTFTESQALSLITELMS